MTLAPVILFTYNRAQHTKETLEALLRNAEAPSTQLIVFSDGSKHGRSAEKVNQVRNYLRTVTGFKSITVVERERNLGLAENIIQGVSEVIARFGKAIILEDDMVTSPYFLKYMNDALEIYRATEDVVSIHGYLCPVQKPLPETFFLRGADCWGWATWERGWKLFEADGSKLLATLHARNLTHSFDLDGAYPYTKMLEDQIAGRNNSWAIRWHASAFIHNRYTLHPGRSLVSNTGGDGSGTHLEAGVNVNSALSDHPVNVQPQAVMEHLQARAAIAGWYRKWNAPDFLSRTRRLLSKLTKRIRK